MIPLLAAALLAAAPAQEGSVELRGSAWVNSKELSLERLKGKIVVLYFYEETWPTCRAEIPGRNQLRKSYADQPVVFIAVNSGTGKADVEGYAKSTGFEWPILVDTSRAIEKAYIGAEISLQNIYQFVVVDPEGRPRRVGPAAQAAEAAVKQLLPTAKFFFDGIAVPDRLKPLAKDIELGFYEPAVGELAAATKKGSKDLQEAAQAMYGKLTPMAEAGLERGKAAREGGKAWEAYTEYERVAAWFRKTDYEKTANAALSELRKDKGVKDELKARQILEQARALLSSGKKAEAAQAQGLLQALAKKFPETEAGREAARLAK